MQQATTDPPRPTSEGVAHARDLVTALREDGTVDPAFREGLADAAALHRHLVTLRLVSARMVALQRSEAVAFHASSIGEEAPIAAAALALREADWLFPGVREWGAALVRGLPLASYVHQAFGSAKDPAKGHAAPDHPSGRAVRAVPASGVVGAHVPMAVGCAWAARIRKEDVVTVALFGEGVVSGGDFHNAMNFADVFKVPAVLVCRSHGRAHGASKGVAYGVASARVDGTDAIATAAVLRAAAQRAAEGRGPTLVEVVTEPLAFEGDPPDVLALGERDPIVRLRRALERESLFAADDVARHVRETEAALDQAVEAAKAAGAPPPGSIFEDVYAEVPPHLAAQRETATWRR